MCSGPKSESACIIKPKFKQSFSSIVILIMAILVHQTQYVASWK